MYLFICVVSPKLNLVKQYFDLADDQDAFPPLPMLQSLQCEFSQLIPNSVYRYENWWQAMRFQPH